jgi:hypothetical protein
LKLAKWQVPDAYLQDSATNGLISMGNITFIAHDVTAYRLSKATQITSARKPSDRAFAFGPPATKNNECSREAINEVLLA